MRYGLVFIIFALISLVDISAEDQDDLALFPTVISSGSESIPEIAIDALQTTEFKVDQGQVQSSEEFVSTGSFASLTMTEEGISVLSQDAPEEINTLDGVEETIVDLERNMIDQSEQKSFEEQPIDIRDISTSQVMSDNEMRQVIVNGAQVTIVWK